MKHANSNYPPPCKTSLHQVAEALARCQQQHRLGAWLGACSGAHAALRRCMAAGGAACATPPPLRLAPAAGTKPAAKTLPAASAACVEAAQHAQHALADAEAAAAEQHEQAVEQEERADLAADCFTIFHT